MWRERSIKGHHHPKRDAHIKTRRDDDDDALTPRGEDTFSLPWLPFLRDELRRCIRRCHRREEQGGKTHDNTTLYAKRFQSTPNENDGARNAFVLKDAHIRARDVEFANNQRFKSIHVSKKNNNIVHGALLVSMFPALVGTTFQGREVFAPNGKVSKRVPGRRG